MKASELRQAILQAAVQGKLVPQNPHDETAFELLKCIDQEKARLIKEGKIKKEKPLSPIIETEIPYDLPAGWVWCKLNNLSKTIHYGYTASASESGNAHLLRITDIQNDKVNWSHVPYCTVTESELKTYKLNNRDILIARTGGTVGKTYIVDAIDVDSVFASYLIRVVPSELIDERYLKYYLQAPFYWEQIVTKAIGTGQPNINGTSLKNLLVSLPPLAEQRRIVAKVDELMALCDELEAEEKRLDALEAHFAEYMPKAILQAAVQGKLVPQNPHDEPASELLKCIQHRKAQLVKEGKLKKGKPLSPVTDDEIPYDLPEGWEWCRLGSITNVIMGQSPQGDSVGEAGNGIEFHQGKIAFSDKYLQPSSYRTVSPSKIAPANSVLLSVRAPVGAVNITKRMICIGRGLCAIEPLCSMDCYFLFYFVKSMERSFVEQSTGTTFIAVTGEVVNNQLFPLPPFAEQQRIVAKMDELMALCNELKSAYTTPVEFSKPRDVIPFPAVEPVEETLLAARGGVGQLSDKAMQAIDDLFAEDEE